MVSRMEIEHLHDAYLCHHFQDDDLDYRDTFTNFFGCL